MTDMDIMDMNEGIENQDYFMQNEENPQQPKTKKLRKLVKKNKGVSSSDDENNQGNEDNENKKSQNNTESNEIDNNLFENKLLIQGQGDNQSVQKVTYKSKLDELSEQIAQMDASKKQRRSNKKKNFSEDNEYQYFDEDEEKKIAEKSQKKTQRAKKQKEQIEVEKNEDMIKRLADKFNDEEEDNADNYKGDENEDIDEDYELNPESNKKKKAAKKDGSKANQNAAIIKTNNKLFKEINTLEQSNLDNIEEQPVEEEYMLEESIKFERQNNKNQKNLKGFLKQSMIYKKQRGIDYESSQNKLKETIIQERSQSYNASKSLALNEEEQREQIDEKASSNELLMNEGIQLNTISSGNQQSNEDSQKHVDFSNIQRQISSTSIGAANSQDKKLQLLKQSSQKIQKMLSFSQSQNLSQSSNKFTQSQDDDLELDLQVPTVDHSQKHQSLINNTLFFNKIIRTNNQNILMKQTSTFSANSNSQALGSQSSVGNIPEKKKLFSRNEYLKQGQKKITERKSQNLNLEVVQNTFKQTSFDHLLSQKELKGKRDSNKQQSSENGEDAEKSKNQESVNDDHENDSQNTENDSQNTENDSDYDPNKNESGDDDEELKEKKDDMQEDNEEDKQRQLIEAEIQYRKLLALEEGIDEKEFERQIRLEYGLVDGKEDEEEKVVDNDEEEDDDNKENNEEEDEEEELENQLEAYEDEMDKEKKNNGEMIEEINEERKPMKRLKNIASEILKKQQEKKEKERIRQQKEERRKQLLSNPIMKKIMNEMIDDEAELGSDNEENDDKIKEVGNEDEHREAGLSKDEDLDAELKELINNVVDFNEEHEQLAASKFIRDLAKKDKEEIKKIIEGAYKGTRAKRRNLSDLLEEEGETSESKKLKRIQDAIRTLQEQNGDNDEDEDTNAVDLFNNMNGYKSKSKGNKNGKDQDDEKEQIQMREANLLLKKEYQKVSGANKFDEKKLIDSDLLGLIQNKQVTANRSSSFALGQNINGQQNSKKIIPTKISESVGIIKGNLSFGSDQPSFAQLLVNSSQSNQQNANGLNNMRGPNIKNSILHVKNNKNRFSQFNDSFNKESLINEFGESALTKAFQNHADHSQSIFYSKQNNEDSNSRPLDKGNKLTKQSSSNQNQTGQGSTSQSYKNISSINRLFKSNSVSLNGPAQNQFIGFGKKKFSTTSNDSKN